jgi:glycosyltransferase involved in cell wall biosynthesis
LHHHEAKLNICINRQPVNTPWGGGAHFFNAFHTFAPQITNVPMQKGFLPNHFDVILLAGLDGDGPNISLEQALAYKAYIARDGKDVKIVLRANENDARKGTNNVDKRWMAAFQIADGVVFVSHWLRQYFAEKGYYSDKDTVIINGVDSEIFKPAKKLDNDLINIVTHHWSNNPLKGFDFYDKLDQFVGLNRDKYSFTYIGRDRDSFKNTKVVKPLVGKALGAELGKYDIYLSASRADPLPNHILESLACELPTYVHIDGGGAVEAAGKSHAYSTWEDFLAILKSKDFAHNDAIQLTDWKTCIQQYISYFEVLNANS